MAKVSDELFGYIVEMRRRIHRRPEIGFDLPETAALVRAELDKLGVKHNDRFAPCSAVAYFGENGGRKTLAVRADMDALPVEEKVDIPYKSEISGRMHACGHDTHTAILLGLARYLKEHESELPCNVRLIFQPSEEWERSGARLMTENGVMEGVDAIICTHCEPTLSPTEIGYAYGVYMAACMPFVMRFYGKTSHAAAAPEKGIDAIKMACEAYTLLADAVKETFGEKRYVWNVGVFNGGTAPNVIADYCELKATFRFFDEDTAAAFKARAIDLLNGIAEKFGGRVEVEAEINSHATYNDPALTERFVEIMKKDPAIKLTEMPVRMSSEDFNWYLQKAPGMIFRYGIKNEATGCGSAAHSNTFKVDESGMRTALSAFIDFISAFK